MKFLNKYPLFFESSQLKKLKQYVGYSTVLKWYAENKERISDILGCDIKDLATEEELLRQSYDITNKHNTHAGGNEVLPNDRAGYKSFKPIENNLIYGLLLNIYKAKHERVNDDKYELTESELVAEIECLAIEESFMKYLNIKYLKSDFINNRLNRLASYLVLAILRDDPERIQKILDEQIEPYLEVNGKQYPIENTGFERLFKIFDNNEDDSKFNITKSNKMTKSEALKNYMVDIINVVTGIEHSSGYIGDETYPYPGNNYFGNRSWYDLTDSEQKTFIEDNFGNLDREDQYFLLDEQKNDIDKFEFDYVVINQGRNLFKKEDTPERLKIELDAKVNNFLNKFNFGDYNIKHTDDFGIKIFPDKIEYDKGEIYIQYLNKRTNKQYDGYIKIDNIPNYLTTQLNLNESHKMQFSINKFMDREDLDSIPILNKFIDESGLIDMEDWFDWLEDLYKEELTFEVNIPGTHGKTNSFRFMGICRSPYTIQNGEDTQEEEVREVQENLQDEEETHSEKKKVNYSYSILTSSRFTEIISDYFNENNQDDTFPDSHEFIDKEEYQGKPFVDIANKFFWDDDAVKIMRKNFRSNDLVLNNTDLGGKRNNKEVIPKKNPINSIIDFSGDYIPDLSLSKNVFTHEGKNLINILTSLKSYIINNADAIKQTSKRNIARFKDTTKQFNKININELQMIAKMDPNQIKVQFEVNFGLDRKSNTIKYSTYANDNQSLVVLNKFYSEFDNIKSLTDLIETPEDIEHIKNFVNFRGDIKTSGDYLKLKEAIDKIAKMDIFKYRKTIEFLSKEKHSYPADPSYIKLIAKIAKDKNIEDDKLKRILHSMVIDEFSPNLKIKKNITIDSIKSYDVIIFFGYINP